MRSIGWVPVVPIARKFVGGIMILLRSPCFGDLQDTCGVGRWDVGSFVAVSVVDILGWNMPGLFWVGPIVETLEEWFGINFPFASSSV